MPKKKKVSGTDFEFHICPTVRRNFPLWQGWRIDEQPTTRRGYRPDFVLSKRKVHAVIDAKEKVALEPRDIDQILDYKSKTKARRAMIYVANDTEVPSTVKDYVDSAGVKIRRVSGDLASKHSTCSVYVLAESHIDGYCFAN